jgi:excinuclease ABC subunit B
MASTMEETRRRREKQEAYNAANGLVPTQITRSKATLFEQSELIADRPRHLAAEPGPASMQRPLDHPTLADPVIRNLPPDALRRLADETRRRMEAASEALDYLEAARLRDEYFALESLVESPS